MASFDALAAARQLEGAGMERRQAEAVAAACREAAGADRAELAARADLAALETRLTSRIVGIVVGVNGAFAALIVGLLVAVLDRLP